MFVANSSACPFRRVFMKLSMIRASGPFAWTVMVYVTFVDFPSGARSMVPVMSMFSACPRNFPGFSGTCSSVSVRTSISWDRGPIFTFRFQRARVSSRISTDCTPGTQPPIFRMSLTNAQTRSTGARTSNVAVPSGIPRRQCTGRKELCSAAYARTDLAGVDDGHRTGSEIQSIRERAEVLPILPRRVGFARLDSALAEKRKARALVDADLSVLRHFVHRFAALRFPLAEEVDRYFRSLLQFHVSRVQRPSLVRVRHV